jgi:hypothetical protein
LVQEINAVNSFDLCNQQLVDFGYRFKIEERLKAVVQISESIQNN